MDGAGPVAGKSAAVGGGDDREASEAKERPAFPGDLAVPDDFAAQVMAAQPLGATRQADPGDAWGRALGGFDQEWWIGGVEREADRWTLRRGRRPEAGRHWW